MFQRLLANTQGIGNIHCYPLALAGETGTATFYVCGGGGDASSSLLAPKETFTINPHVTFPETISVPTMTLDDWAEQHNFDRVDFLWLDMQGAELALLESSPVLLSRVQVIHLEVSIVELYEKNPLYTEVSDWLNRQGFELEVEEIIPASSGNALFLRRNNPVRWDRIFYLVYRQAIKLFGSGSNASR